MDNLYAYSPLVFLMLERTSARKVSVMDGNVPSIGGMKDLRELGTWFAAGAPSSEESASQRAGAFIEAVRMFVIITFRIENSNTSEVENDKLCQGKFPDAYIQEMGRVSGVMLCLLKRGISYASVVAKDLERFIRSKSDPDLFNPVSAIFLGSVCEYISTAGKKEAAAAATAQPH